MEGIPSIKDWPASRIEKQEVTSLIPYANNARTHSEEQVSQIAASMKEWGWTNPVLVDEGGTIIAGHGRILAAQRLGIEKVPVMVAKGWSEAQKKAYTLADNKLAENAGWDTELLGIEMEGLGELEFDLSLIGFDESELAGLERHEGLTDPDEVPDTPVNPTSRTGDLWKLGKHWLLCGDCTAPDNADMVLQGRKADLCLTDPPYGLGEKKHSGKNDYSGYDDTLENLQKLAMEWQPIAVDRSETVVFSSGVTRQWIYPEPDWVICWFYGGGQLRSPWGFNCWQPFLCYGKDPSLRNGRGARPDAVDMNIPANAGDINHPCPKPVKLWEWFLDRLTFSPNAVLYEPFSGSGTTIIAAEQAGLSVAAIEISPLYIDVAIERWQNFTGEKATLGDKTFEDMTNERYDAAKDGSDSYLAGIAEKHRELESAGRGTASAAQADEGAPQAG